MAKKKNPQGAEALVATLLQTVVPPLGGRPACGSDAGAVATRAPVGAFANGSVLELLSLHTGEVLARIEIESTDPAERFISVAIDPEGQRAAGVFASSSGWFIALLERGKSHTPRSKAGMRPSTLTANCGRRREAC